MAGAGPSQVVCSSHPLWSYTPYRPAERPNVAVLQSISTHAPLRSITAVPEAPAPTSQRLQAPALAPYKAYKRTGTDRALRQQQRQQHLQQQQQLLEQLVHRTDAVVTNQHSSGNQPALQERLSAEQLAPLDRLIAAAKWRLQLDPAELQLLVHQLQPLLSALKPGQLAHTAHAVSVLPNGAAAAAGISGWQPAVLAASARLFAAGRMDDWASSVLLQALAKLGIQPGPAWCHAACAGMHVSCWESSRALSTVAACLPQLGHVPSSSWAAEFFAATAVKMHEMPPVSLARMLHGVVAWRHLQLQQLQQQVKDGSEQLVLPEHWLTRSLQELLACSSELQPCEVAMLLQAVMRLQQPSFLQQGTTPAAGQQQAQSLLQQCSQQLLHALMPAVVRQRQDFGPQDFAVVLHSLAQLQQPDADLQGGQQQLEQLCSWEWLQHAVPAVQARLPEANARTQVTTMWAVAALVQPHLQQQAQQQHQAQQQWQQQQRLLAMQQPGADRPAAGPEAGLQQEQQRAQQQKWGQPQLVRPLWQGGQQQQQAAAAASLSQAVAATSAAAAAAAAAVPTGDVVGLPAAGGNSLRSALQALTAVPAVISTDAGAAAEAAAAGAAGVPAADAAAMWLAWLDSFYAASLPRLHTFSAEDLVVAACTLATQRQVPPVPWYEQLLSAIHHQLPVMTQGQLSGVAWALGRMALLPCRHDPGASLVPLRPWLHALYARTVVGGSIVDAAGSASSAAAAPAAGTDVDQQGPVSGDVSLRGGRHRMCSAAEVVWLMWSAAVCDYDPGSDWWQAAEQLLLTPVDTHAPYVAPGAASNTVSSGVSGVLEQQHQRPAASQLPTRLLGTLLQAYAASGRQLPDKLLQAVITPDVCRRLCSEPVTNTLRVLRGLMHTATPGTVVPQQWLRGVAVGLQDRLVLCSVQELGQLMVALADAGLQGQALVNSLSVRDTASIDNSSSSSGSSSWAAAVAQTCQLQLTRLSASDVSRVLWGAAKLQLQLPAETMQALLQQMQAGFLDASPSALAVGIDAVTRLGVVPSRDWVGGFLMATHRTFTAAATAATTSGVIGASGDGSLGRGISSIRARQALAAAILQTVQGLARLNAAPPAKWIKQQLLLLHGQLPLLQPRHIASLLLLLGRLKCRPSPMYLHSMLSHLGDCSSCSAVDIAHIAYGIASLRWQPNKHWMQLFLAASASKLHQMTNQGLALTQWALAVTRVTPAGAWRREAVRVVAARLGQLDALQMSMVVWAWGRLQVHLTPVAVPRGVALSAPELALKWQGERRQQQAIQQLMGSVQQLALRQAASAIEVSTADAEEQGGSKGDSQPSNAACSSRSSSSGGSGDGGAIVQKLPPLGLSQHWQQRRHIAQQLLAAALQLSGQYNAVQLCHLLAGLARMQLYPTQAWLHAAVTQGSSQSLSVLDGYQMQQLLWALARLQYRASQGWVAGMGVLLETKWQQNPNTRHSAEWALHQLRMLAQDAPGSAEGSL